MEGWTEDEIRNKELRAPCGIFCGACAIYIATRDRNEKLRDIICGVWKTTPEETQCFGCMQSDKPGTLFAFCRDCAIRDCARSKGLYSCHQCEEWPCDIVEQGHLSDVVPPAVKQSVLRVLKRAIPLWRDQVAEHGDEIGSLEWARAEAQRYHCPSCGKSLFRSAQICRVCRTPVADELDGVI